MRTKLDEFWDAQAWSVLERLNGWKVSRDGDRVFLDLPAKDSERYRVLCLCDNYPASAPGVTFVSAEGSKEDPKAWPRGVGQFHQIVHLPPSSFLCTELTREGLVHHPEWKNHAKSWNGQRHTLMDIFNLIHRLLHSSEYQGRGGT